MPWLIKNADVIQLEPKQQQQLWWKRRTNTGNDASLPPPPPPPPLPTSGMADDCHSNRTCHDDDTRIPVIPSGPVAPKPLPNLISTPTMIPTTSMTTTTTSSSSIRSTVPSQQPQLPAAASSSSSLFFVHVPRCGGTSLMHYYQLPHKIYTYYHYNLWKRLGMYAFFSRYKTLERYNFPVWTSGNAFAVLSIGMGIYFLIDTKNNYIPYNLGILLIGFGITLFVLLTIIFTAPVIGRFPIIHHAYLIFVHYILCQFMECTTYCTGTNKTGYIMHLTAHKLLHTYQYVTIPQWEISCSMAIIRNPYSRMISIYTYNRFGEWESFTHFMNDWYTNVCLAYRTNKTCEEWYTPCHAIPQFEYTHDSTTGRPLVKSIVKQEELKYLKQLYHQEQQQQPNDTGVAIIHPATTTTTSDNQNTTTTTTISIVDIETQRHESADDSDSDKAMIVPTTTATTTTATGEDTAEAGRDNNSHKKQQDSLTPTQLLPSTSTSTTTAPTTTMGKSISSIQNLPDTVRDALMNMPHSNQRTLSKGEWYDYYTQHTLNLVYEIYYEDFNYFSYHPILHQRPDLQPPILYHELYHPKTTTTTTTTTDTTLTTPIPGMNTTTITINDCSNTTTSTNHNRMGGTTTNDDIELGIA